ncbi:DNA topoisomerase III alpha [Homo sapiens]|uniref:DNA topoisomerase 3-alpha n=5 Tax=Homo sapiens TaxID=9606 RepID=TOP3A_HUMAN|nr:DNA topoisomerase 3-alpha isoform 1 [Homo sapiens]Q13472.1 RecName: Full=DNA topoisomerase 3-alpha; AltName: Full=DNA topoisomerase III alpha [Homo sapiens]AAB03694.1 DNA topoisomerase III [Homo sapiens]AAH51748.1 Topoisomerase (DNA) III alpha [Homo sapiens]ADP90454.1 DNA topoisomerase 3-alpha [Homo sapiens]ADP90455.1 DNA topoisomerase 3-alpha [Homo sapiens]ADP90456.1 DNA topoisomerase 3-alpha [Homo sapiens]|eukprot:NP_004609.1 DNA topoisomerase 3-alpha isoform 1 [Homo sapiens]
MIFPVARYALRWLRRPEDRAFSRAAMEMALRGVRKVLCVAEKNDAAKGIADLLSNGRMRRREGLSKFNKIYEFDYHLYGQNVTMVMTSVSGHLLAHDFQMQFRKWQSCNPLVLFEAEIEKYCPENFVDIKKTLERETRQCQALVIWTDCDREGENIGFEIIHVCKAVKPNLQVLRARFSEITPHAVRTACENLTEPDQRVSDAVDVRQELDLRIGAAFTRFQTLRLQRIFPEVLAEQLISYGSCQFPTLGFVVERFKAIQAFVPEIFHRIKVTHDHKDGIVEFNWKRHRLFNHTACLVLYQLCVEDPMATVVEVRSKPKSKWRPQALDTVELEKLASRKLRINAKETMRIAEKLYTQGYISYPRTETNIFPRDLNLTVLVEQQTPDPRWGAFAQSILERGGPTPRNGNKSDQAHPPIHPTKYTNNLQGDEQRLYEFIVRHFLACCSQDAQGQETTVEIDIAQERFVAHGLMILARNYLDVYPYDHWSDKILPVYEQGSHFQPSTVEMVDGETSPPKLLTEADLIALMEKHGIGTDATHAEHIETIKARMYVGLTPDKRFLPGHLGMGLVEGYDSMGYEMSKPDLRAELEADLKLICDGKKDKFVVLRQQVQKYKQVFIEAVAKAKKLDEALAQYFGNGTELAQQEDIYPAMPEPIRKCPQCNKDMVLKTKKNGGFYLSCMGFPECRSAVWLPDSVLEASRDSSVCPVCQPHPVYRLKLKFKRGSLPPTMPLEFVCCIGGCDDTLREILDLRFSGGPPRASQPSGRLQANQSLNRMDNSQHPQPADSRQTGSSKALAQTLPPPTAAGESNSVTCNCGQEAVLLTVRKEGPNRGRQFFKCNGGSCNFFLWADSPNPGAGGPPALAYRPLGASLGCPPGPGIHLGGFGNPGDGSGSGTSCLCSQPSVTRTVQKDGPNKGRQFHTCAKPREQQCGFFQWVDENTAPGTSGAPSWTGDRGRTLESEARSKRPRASSSDMGSTAKKPRKCSLCHQPGHTRPFCPQNR